MDRTPEIDDVLNEVGPRLTRLRTERGITLAVLSESTGISKSTLSRLESGGRRPNLELLLPIARAYQVPLDELVGAPEVGDPRVRLTPRELSNGATALPLTRQPGALQAFKMILPGGPVGPAGRSQAPEPKTHEGYEWLYVLSGRLRLVLADHDLVLVAGEAAEFDTRLPHAFSSADDHPVEMLSLFGRQGERVHLRAKPSARGRRDDDDGSRQAVS
ncbi:helix-turn-helix domain-containing protein [Streptomyces sp. H27-D2]|uniref:helix-turn-helix domain-containing protein n=1 Tax=Streptomyces sp. H27-D2 TaxID=3046304 RepID=UPI002DB890BC|nr:XRE family transcriptional regulator [Streptomyces sp. H27-D2]MEC4018239.1 XRE family transcriptional regulator [Streptomyces sp. H27-D2]